MDTRLKKTIDLLDNHYASFFEALNFAKITKQTTPSDTKSYSEILVSLLVGINGRDRRKGSDLEDGSDVKAANAWEKVDTPRFNGCVSAGNKTNVPSNITSVLDAMPYLFFVLWDYNGNESIKRCRVWVVSPQQDNKFRSLVKEWYSKREIGEIKSDNLQLHPPIGNGSNILRNTISSLQYPLLFCAENSGDGYKLVSHTPSALKNARCVD